MFSFGKPSTGWKLTTAARCAMSNATSSTYFRITLVSRVDAERLAFRVYNDYPIILGQYRHLSVDLALV